MYGGIRAKMSRIIWSIIVMILLGIPLAANGNAEVVGSDSIFVVATALQQEWWQIAQTGSERAAADFGRTINFQRPDLAEDQAELLQNALAANPLAIVLAAHNSAVLMDQLQYAVQQGIPIVGFAGGVLNAPPGSVLATASASDYSAGEVAAENIFVAIEDKITETTESNPVTIIAMSQNGSDGALLQRGQGFRDKMVELIAGMEDFSRDDIVVVGNVAYVGDDSPATGEKIIIEMVVPPAPQSADMLTAARAVFTILEQNNVIAVFCLTQEVTSAFLEESNGGADLSETYNDIVLFGYGSGQAQKDAVRQQYLLGSLVPNPYQIGYRGVELADRAIKGESISDIDIGVQFYNYENIDSPAIVQLLID